MRYLHPTVREQPHLLQLEKSPNSNKDPAQPKINTFFKIYAEKNKPDTKSQILYDTTNVNFIE